MLLMIISKIICTKKKKDIPDVVREMEFEVLITGLLTIFKGHFKCHNEFCLKACLNGSLPLSLQMERRIIFVVGKNTAPDCFISTLKQLQHR